MLFAVYELELRTAGRDAISFLYYAGQLRGRANLMLRGMSPEDRQRTIDWIDSLSPAQVRALGKSLTR
jgi:hypothetical protein